jgi:ribonuclease BN (tRNA processing enzyme)
VISAITALALTTQIVLLGTGDPESLSRRAGPATAIVIDGRTYLVDFGPGVVRRAAAAHEQGLVALDPVNLTHAFVTQLHFEHTAGYPDLVFIPSSLGRKQPLEVYGPPGIRALTDHVLAAWNGGVAVNAHEVAPGLVYRDDKIAVTAFAGGYRLQTADRKIVIASATSPAQTIVAHCSGCDVLIDEVQLETVRQLGELATRARPELLLLHRQGTASEEQLARMIGDVYRGRFIVGHDLDVY